MLEVKDIDARFNELKRLARNKEPLPSEAADSAADIKAYEGMCGIYQMWQHRDEGNQALIIQGRSIRAAYIREKRDELLKIAYGLWDYVKNAPENKAKNANWRLDWVGILPGKRESRRYLGDVIMTQNDVSAGGHFRDIVAYGGWQMDDHDPRGFYSKGHPNVNYPAPCPYGIPYRSLYSRNVSNLLFAGRNISVTHWALSSTRAMGTCAIVGQAVGTAAYLATFPEEATEKLENEAEKEEKNG